MMRRHKILGVQEQIIRKMDQEQEQAKEAVGEWYRKLKTVDGENEEDDEEHGDDENPRSTVRAEGWKKKAKKARKHIRDFS